MMQIGAFMTEARVAGMWLAALALCLGFALMLLSSWRHHRRAESRFHARLWTEMTWVGIPVLMVALLAWPVAKGVLL